MPPAHPRSRPLSRRAAVVGAVILALSTAACGSDDDPADTTVPGDPAGPTDGQDSTSSLPLPEATPPPNPDAGAGGGATSEP